MSRTIGDNTPGGSRALANLRPAWEKGKSGNPKGRPKSARSRLAEAFLRDFSDVWDAETLDVDARMSNGKRAIMATLKEDPAAFVKMAAYLLPKNYQVDIDVAATPGSAFADLLRAYNESRKPQSVGH